MKKLITGILAGLLVFLITRTLAYLFDLDAVAQELAQRVLLLPASQLYLSAWLLSGFIGLIALMLWLIFNVDERLSNIRSPRPVIGSLPVAGDPTFKIDVNRTTGKNNAELFVDLINKSDRLIEVRFELRATINGKDLDRPTTGQALVSPNQKTRLFVRIDDVPMQEDLLASLEYDVTYLFKGTKGKSRRTAKGIEWKAQKPKGQPGAKGGKVVKVVTVRYYNEIEE